MPGDSLPLSQVIARISREAAWAPIVVVVLHAIAGKLFGHEPYVDPAMHFLGGCAMALFFSRLFALPYDRFGMLSQLTHTLLVFGLACTVALFWEFGEYAVDQWLGTNMQRGLDNTMRDLLLGTAGALLYLIWRQLRQ